jgi:hypothetical protein
MSSLRDNDPLAKSYRSLVVERYVFAHTYFVVEVKIPGSPNTSGGVYVAAFPEFGT